MDPFDLPGPEFDGFDHRANAERIAADRDRRTAASIAAALGVSRQEWEGYLQRTIAAAVGRVLPAIAGNIVAAGLAADSQRDDIKSTIVDLIAEDLAEMVTTVFGELNESKA